MSPILRPETRVILLGDTRYTANITGNLHYAGLGEGDVTSKNYYRDAAEQINMLSNQDAILFFLGSFGFEGKESKGLFDDIRKIMGAMSYIIARDPQADYNVPTHLHTTKNFMLHFKEVYLDHQSQ